MVAMSTDGESGILIAPAAVTHLTSYFGAQDFVGAVQAFRGVRMLSHRMSEAASGWLAPHGLTVAQYNFLAALFSNGDETGLSSRDVGQHLHTTSGTVTSMTNTLERAGLVQRRAHGSDRRSVLIRLTPKGRRRFVAAAATHHACAVDALGDVDPPALQALLELLVRAGNSLEAFKERAEPTIA